MTSTAHKRVQRLSPSGLKTQAEHYPSVCPSIWLCFFNPSAYLRAELHHWVCLLVFPRLSVCQEAALTDVDVNTLHAAIPEITHPPDIIHPPRYEMWLIIDSSIMSQISKTCSDWTMSFTWVRWWGRSCRRGSGHCDWHSDRLTGDTELVTMGTEVVPSVATIERVLHSPSGSKPVNMGSVYCHDNHQWPAAKSFVVLPL